MLPPNQAHVLIAIQDVAHYKAYTSKSCNSTTVCHEKSYSSLPAFIFGRPRLGNVPASCNIGQRVVLVLFHRRSQASKGISQSMSSFAIRHRLPFTEKVPAPCERPWKMMDFVVRHIDQAILRSRSVGSEGAVAVNEKGKERMQSQWDDLLPFFGFALDGCLPKLNNLVDVLGHALPGDQ